MGIVKESYFKNESLLIFNPRVLKMASASGCGDNKKGIKMETGGEEPPKRVKISVNGSTEENVDENGEMASASGCGDNKKGIKMETGGEGPPKRVKISVNGSTEENVDENGEMEFDKTAYVMYHAAQTGSPCLSFDILPDDFGTNRSEYPLTTYLVAGTQSDIPRKNKVLVMKMNNLHKMEEDKNDDDQDSSSDEDNDEMEEKEPKLLLAMMKHNGCVNRTRATQINNRLFAATWSEFGKVHIWDLMEQMKALNDAPAMVAYLKRENPVKPCFTFSGHPTEGFAMDWSPLEPGRLATGDCRKFIHLWKPHESTWIVDARPYTSHTDSVEDIQWSPTETNVLASCSVDKSIRIWDARVPKSAMLTINDAHTSDVNVISWNKKDPFLVSGGDDGVIKVWDLKQIESQKPVAVFKHHTGPITSVEWNPNDSTVFAAAGGDDQITQWDLSVEKDDEMETEENEDSSELPPQLLFVHQGQKEIKELHWHPQIPGVVISTANSGFNIFRTISV